MRRGEGSSNPDSSVFFLYAAIAKPRKYVDFPFELFSPLYQDT